MVEGSGYRLLRVSRGAHELSGTGCVPISRRESLATLAPATKSKGRDDVGTNDEDRCGLAAATSNPTSMAGQAVCRQTPEVGAECVNCACSDLCGGRSVMGVPTAITRVASRRNVTRRPVVVLAPFFPLQFNGRRLWACGRRLRRWATHAAQRRVVHGRSRCAAGASSTCP